MPTPLDRALKSQNLFLGFAGMVTAVAAWSIWGSDVFPAEADPTGKPEDWTEDELRRWLRNRNLLPSESATRDELLERVKANLRAPRRTKSSASQS
ncbi:Stress-responsive nuclear envelope protein [Penicillium ucsense]|uniref:Stress-responsive nuclear envelope protein n=1 Tax=Penicillium ucsense TaxID=2839758 RepID=A0A8J8W5F2_9EURO|nr:Stress-responsive nuclear envelope protein [Penicillium ucsense]KAF7737921.1 Stress-responsive nuclear envelope protein [Penicillium ucsense]